MNRLQKNIFWILFILFGIAAKPMLSQNFGETPEHKRMWKKFGRKKIFCKKKDSYWGIEKSKNINILKLCSGCGARDNIVLGKIAHVDDWAEEDGKDYCPDCSYLPCDNCGCDSDYPEPEHGSNCKRFVNTGNCTCPPCNCYCH